MLEIIERSGYQPGTHTTLPILIVRVDNKLQFGISIWPTKPLEIEVYHRGIELLSEALSGEHRDIYMLEFGHDWSNLCDKVRLYLIDTYNCGKDNKFCILSLAFGAAWSFEGEVEKGDICDSVLKALTGLSKRED